jgi:hypothetical protein
MLPAKGKSKPTCAIVQLAFGLLLNWRMHQFHEGGFQKDEATSETGLRIFSCGLRPLVCSPKVGRADQLIRRP